MNEPSRRLIDRIKNLPQPFDPQRGDSVWSDLLLSVEKNEPPSEFVSLIGMTVTERLVKAIGGNSPYLSRLILKNPLDLLWSLNADPDELVTTVEKELIEEADRARDMETSMRALRRAKAKMALSIAIADMSGVWQLGQVTTALTEFADLSIRSCLRYLLLKYHDRGLCQIVDTEAPEVDSGIAIFAMGKYGAFELNYSSDIDIVVFFDPDRVPVTSKIAPKAFSVRLVRDLVKMMQEVTGDGYVFRTDLRLRPDPGATAVALSYNAASQYYESLGQNWERAAWIKARTCAGDKRVGEAFLAELVPFIWRRYLDYASIEDIHSIKRQIHAVKGLGGISVEGHNVKLGRGGIREIEFFAQTQQLIGGGRNPTLRERQTLGALKALTRVGTISDQTRADLEAAYVFLRTVEHRIQMVNDQQTHNLPADADGIDRIACFCGFESTDAFRECLIVHLGQVQDHYADLFEGEPSLGMEFGSLVFTGVENDPETLKTLEKMGFKDPANVSELIRIWHHGRIAATRSERGRAVLTKLVPLLLKSMSETEYPDEAMHNFDRFLSNLPGGVQIFSMFLSNPALLDLFVEILGMAPRLAFYLAKNSDVVDIMLDREFFDPISDRDELAAGLEGLLSRGGLFEDKLNVIQIWARELRFRIGVNVIRGKINSRDAGIAFADMADVIVDSVQQIVFAEIELQHGKIEGAFSVLALGKHGSREMSATSDLDLIFVYDFDDEKAQSDGKRPLHAMQYYSKVSQRIISALTAPTSEGQLFEVDARLRPSGRSGPIAVRFESFEKYQREEAWTWERMALTRARVITGPEQFRGKLTVVIQSVLTHCPDPKVILKDALEMRNKIESEKGRLDHWDLKFVRGGMVDIEFIVQAMQLVKAASQPDVLVPNTTDALQVLSELECLPTSTADDLKAALRLYHDLTHVLRICIDGKVDAESLSPALGAALSKTGNAASVEELEVLLRGHQAKVLGHFKAIIG